MQAERVQVYSGGQLAADDIGEVQDQVLAGGLERHEVGWKGTVMTL